MTLRIPKIKSCCCFSLETASKLIGCLHMMFFVAALSLPLLYIKPFHVAIHIYRGMIYESVLLNMGIFSAIMLYGTFKRDRQLIFPWVLLQSVLTLFFLFSVVGHILCLGLIDYRGNSMEFEFFMTLYSFFTMLVVYNFYRNLSEQKPTEQL